MFVIKIYFNVCYARKLYYCHFSPFKNHFLVLFPTFAFAHLTLQGRIAGAYADETVIWLMHQSIYNSLEGFSLNIYSVFRLF